MSTLGKLMAVVFLVCAPAWAQSSSTPAQGSDSKPQTTEPPQTAPESDKQSSPDQTSAAKPADSTKLEPIKIVKADYPWEARDKQLQGQVWVKIQVSEAGDVESAEVISGDPVLAKSAISAVKKWKFKPFIKDGRPVPISSKVPFGFAFSDKVTEGKDPTPDGAGGTQPNSAGGRIDAQPNSPSDEVPQRVRVSAGVTAGLLLHKVAPVYPMDARRAGIQGTVLLRARIGKDGRIADLQLISGPNELAKAAIGAVQQWRYRPYLLMGNPVEVDTQIQVNFTLSPR
jgi:TonB family protein